MPIIQQWGGNFRGRGFKPAKPTSTWKTTGQFNITNYDPSLTWTVTGGTLTVAVAPAVPYVTLPAGYFSATVTASQGIQSDVLTIGHAPFAYTPGNPNPPGSYQYFDWCGCQCQCPGGGCACYPQPSGPSFGQCGCPGAMCWYGGQCPRTNPNPGGVNPPTLNPGPPGYTNNGTEWILIQ